MRRPVASVPPYPKPPMDPRTATRLARGLALVLLLPLSAAAQRDIRWGQLPDEHQALSAVPGDPDAAAVVLWDEGTAAVDFSLRNELRLKVKRHRRVKVLSEAGYGLGEVSLVFGADEQVLEVKGQTFVPQRNGRYQRVSLDRGDIVRQTVAEGVQEVRFSMPGLVPGAIFEVEYETMSERFMGPPAWHFQSDEPTLVSRYTFRAPEMLQYVTVLQGSGVEAEPMRLVDDDYWREQRWAWTARDVPALRPEPFTTTEADYVEKLEIQLRQIRMPGQAPQDVLNTWDGLAGELSAHPSFGRRLGRSAAVSELAASVTGTEPERARALYDLVRTGFVWTGEGGFLADRALDDVATSRRGSTGELGLLLVALLREAGVAADPVLLSTRSNGRVLHEYPLVSRFDHLVVLARPEGAAPSLLDPTDPARPFGLLPVEALAGEAWIAAPGAARWISFQPPAQTSTSVAVDGALAPDGTLDGALRVRLDGYAALDLRHALADGTPQAAALESADGSAEAALVLGEVELEGVGDVEAPVSLRAPFTAQAATEAGGELYLTPLVVTRLEENPFASATRAFPVDFAYPSTRSLSAQITLPLGYAPEALPRSVRLGLGSGAVSYTRLVAFDDRDLRIRTTLTTAAAYVQPEEYAELRALYDEIVAMEGEVLVLVPTGAEAPPAEGPSAEAPPAGSGR